MKEKVIMIVEQITSKNEKETITRQILEALPEWFEIPEAREEIFVRYM